MSGEAPTDIVPALSAATGRSVFLPALLVALAVTGWSGFQTWQLVKERSALTNGIAEQTPQMEQSEKLRDALQKLASGLAAVAKQGNANATIVVEELRRNGITIDDEPAAAP